MCNLIRITMDIKHIKRYLLKEQGFDEEVVNSMTKEDLIDTYLYFTENQ